MVNALLAGVTVGVVISIFIQKVPFILAFTGILSIKYAPYALLCYILPTITLYLGIFTRNISKRKLMNCKKLRV